MFVQVIQGQLSDREAMKRLGDRWRAELRPGATGFLGATAGITDDDELINVVRFDSEEAARRNSDRPEQGEWWAEASKCFRSEPTFVESADVATLLAGGSNDAGFVQAMIGTVPDRAKLEAVDAELMARLAELRPEVIGGLRIWHDGNRCIELVYFTSEAEARAGEAKELPADAQALFEEYQTLYESIEFKDLRDLSLE